MAPILIEDVERGCGFRKPGGCYLESERSAGGNLHPGPWLLDWCMTDPPGGEQQFVVEVAPRAMVPIDPLASILLRALVGAGEMAGELPLPDDLAHLAILGRYGLADHVGEAHYTVWSFMKELRALGPSRRVPPDMAREIAKHLPCPVFFFMPLPIIGAQDDVRAWLGREAVDGDVSFTPTWYHPRWSFLTRAYFGGPHLDNDYGESHFMTRVLRKADAIRLEVGDARAPDAIAAELGFSVEMPFAMSVFTRAVFILPEGEEDLPDELQGSGVLPARMVPAGAVEEESEYVT